MVKVKEEFAAVTCQQVDEFTTHTKNLYKEFKEQGPGASDVSLDDGVDLLRKYGSA